jgi:hypothetical protein
MSAPGRTRTCGPLLSFQHQAFPDRPQNSRVCWLDYILDIAVPTRIVSEEPQFANRALGFLRITQSSWIFTRLEAEYQRLSGRSRIQGRPLNEFKKQTFPIKAPTRQMLYPLSYRGINYCHRMLASMSVLVN